MERFYTKQYSKKDFFNAVLEMAQANDDNMMYSAAAFELEKLENAAAKAAEKRGGATNSDRMASQYCHDLAQMILGVLTSEEQTAAEIAAALEGQTIQGKEVKLNPWFYSVLGGLSGTGKTGLTISDEGKQNINPDGVKVVETMKKVTKKDSKGLIKESLAKAYKLA